MSDPSAQEPAIGPDGLIRSEERLDVTTRRVPAVKAVLRKVIVVEQRTFTVDVAHEEVRFDLIPIEGADVQEHDEGRGAHLALPDLVLHKEEIVLTRRLVPTERVRVAITDVEEEQRITDTVRREQVDVLHAPAND